MAGVLSLLDAVPFLAAKGLVAVALLSRATHKFLAHAVKSRLLHQVRQTCTRINVSRLTNV